MRAGRRLPAPRGSAAGATRGVRLHGHVQVDVARRTAGSARNVVTGSTSSHHGRPGRARSRGRPPVGGDDRDRRERVERVAARSRQAAVELLDHHRVAAEQPPVDGQVEHGVRRRAGDQVDPPLVRTLSAQVLAAPGSARGRPCRCGSVRSGSCERAHAVVICPSVAVAAARPRRAIRVSAPTAAGCRSSRPEAPAAALVSGTTQTRSSSVSSARASMTTRVMPRPASPRSPATRCCAGRGAGPPGDRCGRTRRPSRRAGEGHQREA